ncbi:MAG: DNA-binding transcriptional regulator [Nevskia sp.]|nr:DNA-binding transcriptional regulator [Nevskia sp.]
MTDKTKPKARSRILDTVHATAVDLHAAGLIDLRRMREFDALCLPPVPTYTPANIKSIRAKHNLSQAVMAAALNASLSTVRQWEIGHKKPSGPAAKLLSVLDRKGLDALI